MNMHQSASRLRRSQRGLTLVELLVGLTLGLIITTAMLLLFANASANGQNLARSGQQIESGRYVSELLREDLRLAGFYGELLVDGVNANYSAPDPDPCSTTPTGWNSGSPATIPAPVRGYTPAQADLLTCLSNRKAGTAAIAVRRLSVDRVDPAGISTGNTQYYVQYSFCNTDASSPQLIFDVDKAAFTLRNRACSAPNTVRAYMSRVYYVADCNRCGTGGDTTPTLKRVDLVGNTLVTTALADGVDDLQLEYGFDTTAYPGDGSADVYHPELVTTEPNVLWKNVMTVKAHFITRSLDRVLGDQLAPAQEFELGSIGTVTAPADGYTRRAYSSVIRLVNPSSVRDFQ